MKKFQPTYEESFSFTSGQQSFKYSSLYLGNKMAKELTSTKPPGLCSFKKVSGFQPSGTVSLSSSNDFSDSVISKTNILLV